MNPPSLTATILCFGLGLLIPACNSERGETRESQLEETADSLEAKAEKIRTEVSQVVEKKIVDAEKIRKTKGDDETAKAIEKDATVTKVAGEMRAEQLEKQAEKVRKKKQDAAKDP